MLYSVTPKSPVFLWIFLPFNGDNAFLTDVSLAEILSANKISAISYAAVH